MVKRTDDSNEQGGSRKRSRLSHSSGGPRSGGIGGGTSVYVGNLAYETSWQNLKDHMRKAGNVDSVSWMIITKLGCPPEEGKGEGQRQYFCPLVDFSSTTSLLVLGQSSIL